MSDLLPPVLEYAVPAPEPGRRWQYVLLLVGVIGAPIAAVVCMFEVETIIVSGPILLCVGALLMIFGIRSRYSLTILAGGEHIAIVVGVFVLINIAGWGPRRAQTPVTIIAFLNAFVAVTLGVLALRARSHAYPLARSYSNEIGR